MSGFVNWLEMRLRRKDARTLRMPTVTAPTI
jgi:hypothetical protein